MARRKQPVPVAEPQAKAFEEQVESAFLGYAMSVIVDRALPDVRDGLKPVHRRILWTMQELGIRSDRPHVKCARVVGSCFGAGTLVHTPSGLTPIEDIKVGDEILDGARNTQVVTQTFVIPPGPVLRVHTKDGHAITVTPDQKFRVLNPDLTISWKEAKDLLGERVLRLGHRTVTNPAVPSAADEMEAYVAGLLVAEGSLSHRNHPTSKQVTLAMVDGGPLDAVRSYVAVTGAASSEHLRTHDNPNWSDIAVLKFSGNDRIRSTVATTCESKTIPDWVLGNRKLFAPFLAGVFDGDGHARRGRTRELSYASTSRRLLEMIQACLVDRGIHARIRPYRHGHAEWRDCWAAIVYGKSAYRLAELLAPHTRCAKRRAELERILSTSTRECRENADSYPGKPIFDEISRLHLGGGWYSTPNGKKRIPVRYAGGSKFRWSKNRHDLLLSGNLLEHSGALELFTETGSPIAEQLNVALHRSTTVVERVEVLTEEQETYDIEVGSDEHEFVAEGFLVHNCIGFYHPHGDQAAYGALVRLAQDFSMRVPLIDGHGNFGSPSDPPAAARYTECRLSPAAERLMDGIDEDTVDVEATFDGSRTEPTVLPARFPNLLVNGSEGIAVGLATRIPPHNLREVAAAVRHLIEHPDATAADLMRFVKGPDFPTGALIMGNGGLADAYETGRGTIRVRARSTVEADTKGTRIVITDTPYQVSIEEVADKAEQLVEDGTIQGVRAIRNESARGEIRLVLELRPNGDPDIVLNNLFKHTRLQTTYPIQMIALDDGVPRQMGLVDLLSRWVTHQEDVVRRRSQFRLDKAEARLHIVEGLLRALDLIDEIIAAIRASKDRAAAREALQAAPFEFSDIQASHILDMPLARLTQLGRSELDKEAKGLRSDIRGLRKILKSRDVLLGVIVDEMNEIVDAHGTDRLTGLSDDTGDIDESALVQDEPLIVTVTARGYLSAAPTEGRGNKVASPGDGDVITQVLPCSMLGSVLVFTTAGRCYKAHGRDLPVRKLTAAPNLFSFSPDEKVLTVLDAADYETNPLVTLVSEQGQIKRVASQEFSSAAGRKDGLVAMKLADGDRVVSVFPCSETVEVLAATASGMGIRFDGAGLRAMGRQAAGVRAIRLKADDRVVGAVPVADDATVAVATTTGWAKRMRVDDVQVQGRGGAGVRIVRHDKRTGETAGLVVVTGEDLLAFDEEGTGRPVSSTAPPIRGRDSAGTADVFGGAVARLVPAPVLPD